MHEYGRITWEPAHVPAMSDRIHRLTLLAADGSLAGMYAADRRLTGVTAALNTLAALQPAHQRRNTKPLLRSTLFCNA